MDAISLRKDIQAGTWRRIGGLVTGFSFSNIEIAGSSIRALTASHEDEAFQIGRISPRNAFVLKRGPFHLLYVSPLYRGYRYAAGKVFKPCGWPVDYDHLLSRAVAARLGYAYVLVARIHPSINRAHGRKEMVGGEKIILSLHKTCLADERICAKWLGKRPESYHGRYRPTRESGRGLTLKQAGIFGFSLGVEEVEWSPPSLSSL